MTTIRRIACTATLALGFFLLPAAQAADNPPVPPADSQTGAGTGLGPHSWWTNPRAIEKLDLTADQRKKIEDVVYKAGQRLIDLRADKQKAQLQLARLLGADTLDDGALAKAVDAATTADCALQREELLARVDVARLLTKDQRVQLRDLLMSDRGHVRAMRRGQ